MAMSISAWIWALLGLTGFCLAWHWIKNEDLGFQLNAAKLILQTGDVPRAEPFLWTEPLGKYIDLQWLWQLGMYGCWRWFGYGGLMLVNLGIQFVAFAVWVGRVWRMEKRSLGLGSFVLLLIFFLVNNWQIRPHSLSWVYLGLTLLVLEEQSRGNRRAIWFLPLITLAWVNCHALFSLGLLAVVLWVLVDLGCQLHKQGWTATRHGVLKEYGPVALAALVCILNPYGVEGLTLPLHQARIVAGAHVARNLIFEFQPLWRAIVPEDGMQFASNWFDATTMSLLLLLLVAGVMVGSSRIPLPAWGPILIFALLALRMLKNFNYLFILAGPYAAVGWDAFLARWLVGRQRMVRWVGVAVCAFFCVVVSTDMWSNWFWGPRFGLGFNPCVHPTAMAEVLARCPRELRLLNGHDNGGWLAWISGKKVFIDGRNDNYSEELLRSYNQGAESREAFVALLDHWQIEAVVVQFDKEPYWVPALMEISRNSHGLFKNSMGQTVPLWRCVARDPRVALFFRYDVCPDIPEDMSLENGSESLQGRKDKLDQILRSQALKPEPGWTSFFVGAGAFPLDLNLLVARSIYFGEFGAAKSYAVKAMEGCAWFYTELWSNLAYVFEMEGDTERADFCWKTIAAKTTDPKWKAKEAKARERRRRVKEEKTAF